VEPHVLHENGRRHNRKEECDLQCLWCLFEVQGLFHWRIACALITRPRRGKVGGFNIGRALCISKASVQRKRRRNRCCDSQVYCLRNTTFLGCVCHSLLSLLDPRCTAPSVRTMSQVRLHDLHMHTLGKAWADKKDTIAGCSLTVDG
jgi:hypothetical protein